MYCPVCFNDSLFLKSQGVVQVEINRFKMTTGKFLFNLGTMSESQLDKELSKKLEEYIKWNAQMMNPKDIASVHLYSYDFYCKANGCTIGSQNKISVVGLIYSEAVVRRILEQLCEKHGQIITGDMEII